MAYTASYPSVSSFGEDWRFHLGVPEGGDTRRHFWKAGYTIGPGARFYNDSAWKTVTLPHDWGTELELDFTVNAQHGAAPIGEGVHPNPVGFYRKSFFVPADWQDYTASLRFDGVFRDCEILVNGQFVTRNLSGYTGFTVNLDDLLFYGEVNSIAVRVDASHTEGWFYEGAGIYRDVWLRLLPRLHLDADTAFIRLDTDSDTVLADFDTVNDTEKAEIIRCALYFAGKSAEISVSVPADSRVPVRLSLPVDGYHPWSIDDPYLYNAVLAAGTHTHTVRIGLRRFRFDADGGFFLNGKPVKLLGSCTHQDFGIVGAALNDDEQEYKMRILKQYGFNAVRTSHNPPAPALLDACDKLGLVVMAETRLFGSTSEGIHQLRQLILDGRNHPSVILWSIGNEEIIQATETARRQAIRLCKLSHQLDPTRPTTYAGNNADTLTGINAVVDVRGINYLNISRDITMVDRYHANCPTQPVVGSEESSVLASRSVWHSDLRRGLTENFDNCGPGYMLGAEGLWKAYMARPYLAGAFVWTGFDYRGEASKQGYITNFGVIDLCGFPKSTAHYYRAEGNPAPYLYMYPDWNRTEADGSPTPDGTPVEVILYTNAAAAELFVNGFSCGRQTRAPYASLRFTVPYHPGTILAVGYDADNREILREEMHTSGTPARLTAEVSRIGRTAFIRVAALDEHGILCEAAGNRLRFHAENAILVGAGNGDPSDPDGELPRLNAPILRLKGIRVYESDGDYQYTDQLLTDIIGENDPERRQMHTAVFAPETDAQLAGHQGCRRKLPVSPESPKRYLELYCTFWLDSAEASQYRFLHLGYAAGLPEITLNGKNLSPAPSFRSTFDAGDAASGSTERLFDADGDELCLPLQSALRTGENVLKILIRPNSLGLYAAGHGLWLAGEAVPTLQKRLWNGHALCLADIAPHSTGTVTIEADGLSPVCVEI